MSNERYSYFANNDFLVGIKLLGTYFFLDPDAGLYYSVPVTMK